MNFKKLFGLSVKHLSATDICEILRPLSEYSFTLDITNKRACHLAGIDDNFINTTKRLVDKKILHPSDEMVGLTFVPIRLDAFWGWGNIELIKDTQILKHTNQDSYDQVATAWTILSRNRFFGDLNWPSRSYVGGGVYKKSDLLFRRNASDAFMDFMQHLSTYKQYFDSVKQACRY